MDPVTPFITAISNLKTFIQYGFRLADASEDHRNELDTLRGVANSLNDLKLLFNELEPSMTELDRRRVNRIICDTNAVIVKMATPIRRSRQSVQDHGTVTLKRRILWDMQDKATIARYKDRLAVVHRELLSEINDLRSQLRMPHPHGHNGGSSAVKVEHYQDTPSRLNVANPCQIHRNLSTRSEPVESENLDDEDDWAEWTGTSDRGRASPQSPYSWLAADWNKRRDDDERNRSRSRSESTASGVH